MNFRNDVNGLRAVAVVAVVIFHFAPDILPGGFAGVDVFFVISGFLMTSIIFKGLDSGTFSINRFYIARAKRIVPALAVVCLFLLALGWFILLNKEFLTLSKHIASSLLFLSNFTYWQEAGYFDSSAYEKWLIHTWSLSVEWQFYILYPLVLVLLNKFCSIKTTKLLVLLGCISGYILSIYASAKYPEPSYFLLPARAWEMLLGGLVFLYPINIPPKYRNITSFLGLLAIFTSFFIVSEHMAWPGYFALLPVMGAAIVIAANSQNNMLLSNKASTNIGLWSYSIYLWHWPIVVFSHHYLETDYLVTALLITISVVLGWLLYTLIEKRRTKAVFIYPFCFALAFSVFIFINKGQPPARSLSIDERNPILDLYDNYTMDPSGIFSDCNASVQMADKGAPIVKDRCLNDDTGGLLLWGDSHMGSLSTGIRNHLNKSVAFSQLTSSGCEPSFRLKRNGQGRFHEGCDYSNQKAYEFIHRNRPDTVIIGAHGGHENIDWLETINTLKTLEVKTIVVIGPLPQWRPSLPKIYLSSHYGKTHISDHRFVDDVITSNEHMKSLRLEEHGAHFINVIDELCTVEKDKNPDCKVLMDDNELLAFDYGHLTVNGSNYVARTLLTPYLN